MTRRAALGYWGSSLAVGVATFVMLGAVARHLDRGGLADATALIALTFVTAVVPGALQLRAAAAAARGDPVEAVPWRPVLLGAGLLALAAPVAGAALALPVAGLVLVALQLPPACALAQVRGADLGAGRLDRASLSFGLDAACRLAAGVGLGLALGATGVAAVLVLSSLLPLALLGRRPLTPVGPRPPEGELRASVLALGALMLLVNVDVLVAQRVLGTSAADRYAAGALVAKGVFFALFALSWLAVPGAADAAGRRQLLGPVGLALGLAAAAAALVPVARPAVAAALGRPIATADVLAPLTFATACAAATWTATAMAVARRAIAPWRAPGLAAALLAAGAVVVRPAPAAFALGAVMAGLAALAAAVRVLLLSAPGPSR
jgi:hypothetical protein